MSEVWYKSGLQFQCKQCGRCCTGDPGYVWVSEEEITQIAQAISLERSRFESSFVKYVPGIGKSLVEFENGDCSLYDTEKRKCSVYQVRPIQCQTWPFWRRNLKSPTSWKKVAKSCPGCDQGTLISQEQIDAQKDKTYLP